MVQFEVKKLSDASNRLYITVTLTKIEAGVLGSTPGKNQTRFLVPASTEYRLSDIIREINPQDKHFLKYLPDLFLSQRQKTAKYEAIHEDKVRIAKYRDEKYRSVVSKGGMPPIQSEADLDGELLRSDIPSSNIISKQDANDNNKNEKHHAGYN